MQHVDRFLLFKSEPGFERMLDVSPQEDFDFPDHITPDVWAEVYDAHQTAGAATMSAEDDARAIFEACRAGDFADHYDRLEDVPMASIMRARIFSDGSVAAYTLSEAPIGNDEIPEFILSLEDLHRDFGLALPFGEAFETGIKHCDIVLRLYDDESFEEYFVSSFAEVTGKDLKDELFLAAIADDLGAVLDNVDIVQRSDTEMTARLSVEVTNGMLFKMQSSVAARHSGHDSDFIPSSPAEAIYEAFLASNETAAPVDLGFEIQDWNDPSVNNDPAPGM